MIVWAKLQRPSEDEPSKEDATSTLYSSIHDFAVLVPSEGGPSEALQEFDFMPVDDVTASLRNLRAPLHWDNAVLERVGQTIPELKECLKEAYEVFYPSLSSVTDS